MDLIAADLTLSAKMLIALCVVLALAILGLYLSGGYLSIRQKMRDPYDEENLKYHSDFNVEGIQPNYTLSNFTALSKITLACRRVDAEAFRIGKMLKDSHRAMLVASFNTNRIRRLMFINGWYFHFHLRDSDDPDQAPHLEILAFEKNEDQLVVRKPTNNEMLKKFNEEGFINSGCEAELLSLKPITLSEAIIERNYAMLEQKHLDAVLRDERYGQYGELVAVAALKRRLDFLRDRKQKYEAEMFSIETDTAGRGLKISWRLGAKAIRGYELLGFRRTGGFHPDQWDTAQNGTLVIHSNKDGETIEFLKEAEAHFYTFYLKPWNDDGREGRCSPLRFQVTLPMDSEIKELREIMERLQEPRVDSSRRNMSQALEELGLVVEFDEAIDAMENSLIEKIKKKKLRKEEEEEKIAFVRDAARLQRDKYQP